VADLALWIWVVLEIAFCEITDGRFICRDQETGARGVAAADRATEFPATFEATVVRRGIPGIGTERSRRATEALPACAAIHFLRQYGTAQRLIAGNQGQCEVVWLA